MILYQLIPNVLTEFHNFDKETTTVQSVIVYHNAETPPPGLNINLDENNHIIYKYDIRRIVLRLNSFIYQTFQNIIIMNYII